jgi:hypothetical protein
MMGIDLHDVPEDRFATDLDKRLGAILRLFPEAGSHATTEDHHFSFHVVLKTLPLTGFRSVGIALITREALLAVRFALEAILPGLPPVAVPQPCGA